MKVYQLIKLLECADPEANVIVMQPRQWVKKQPDIARTAILSVDVGLCVAIRTM